MALIDYWVIGTNRSTLVVVYERKFVRPKDAQLNCADLASRFPEDEYQIVTRDKYGMLTELVDLTPKT